MPHKTNIKSLLKISGCTHFGLIALILLVMLAGENNSIAQVVQPLHLQKSEAQKKQGEEQLAINYFRERQFDKAAVLLKPMFEAKRSQYLYMYYLNSLIELKEFKEAEKVVKKQRRDFPDNFRYLIDQAFIFDQEGESKKSNKLFNELMSELPADRNNIVQIASALQSRGYNDLAITVYKRARQNTDLQYTFNIEMANVYLYNGEYGKVFDSYLDQLESNPNDAQHIRNQLQNLMRMDVDDNLSDDFRQKLLERAQKNTDSEALAEMLLWYSIQIKDFQLALRQAKAIDKRFGFREEAVMELAQIASENHQYTICKEAYLYIKVKKDKTPYYLEASTGYYEALIHEAETNPATTTDEYNRYSKEGKGYLNELGMNSVTITIAKLVAHIEAFALGNFQEAIDMLNQAIGLKNLRPEQTADLKLELADILLASGQIWDATLLYSQVESDMKNEPVGHEAKLKNARVFYYVGEFGWAQANLDILKSATSKLISNDAIDLSLFITDIMDEDTLGLTLRKFATADLYTYQHHYDSALMMLSKIEATNPGEVARPYVLYQKAKLLVYKRNFEAADSVYTMLIDQFPESIKTDNALFQQAELYRINLNNPSGALERYLQLMTDYPESLYSGEARIRYRELKQQISE
ncbi:MAG: tetratricopeptide repeat protein [Bacteroidales bacterium]|jgi:thioredoxin-like negative regulator of GroEL